MELLSIIAIGIITALIAILLKQYKPEIALAISLGGGVLILALAVKGLTPILNEVNSLMYDINFNSEYAKILLKCLGICYITQLASNICTDAGQSAIASKLELAGKISMLLVSMPLFLNLIELATKVINI